MLFSMLCIQVEEIAKTLEYRTVVIQQSYRPFIEVVGWCEGAVYLTSLGRPTDIGLQLGKACYPCSG